MNVPLLKRRRKKFSCRSFEKHFLIQYRSFEGKRELTGVGEPVRSYNGKETSNTYATDCVDRETDFGFSSDASASPTILILSSDDQTCETCACHDRAILTFRASCLTSCCACWRFSCASASCAGLSLTMMPTMLNFRVSSSQEPQPTETAARIIPKMFRCRRA